MTIPTQSVEHVAKLARLELTSEELDRYTQELSKILELVDQLNTLKLDAAEEENPLDSKTPTVFREDQAKRPFERESLLINAPVEEDGFFRVPKILEEGSN